MCRAIFVAAEEVQRFSRTLNSKILPYLGVGVRTQKEVSEMAPGGGISNRSNKAQTKQKVYKHMVILLMNGKRRELLEQNRERNRIVSK